MVVPPARPDNGSAGHYLPILERFRRILYNFYGGKNQNIIYHTDHILNSECQKHLTIKSLTPASISKNK